MAVVPKQIDVCAGSIVADAGAPEAFCTEAEGCNTWVFCGALEFMEA
jgi:hypothetical protein